MKNELILKNRVTGPINRIIGFVWLICGIVYVLFSDFKSWMNYFVPGVFLISGIYSLILNGGILRNRLLLQDGTLKIRWFTRFLEYKMSLEQIHSISADENKILIKLKSGKTLNLSTSSLEPSEKNAAFNFLKEAAGNQEQ
mgnify:CR=1 FL=1